MKKAVQQLTRVVTALAAAILSVLSFPALAQTLGPAALQQKHAVISAQLAQNVFKRPLLLESAEARNSVAGNAYAVINAPFATLNAIIKDPAKWCDMLILHLNTKGCAAPAGSGSSVLVLHVGKKTPQQLKDASRLEFSFRPIASAANYGAAGLQADQGPFGTKNYRIELEAVPLPDGKTFMHLRYGYEFGTAAKLAMQGYLSTVGTGKVGFSVAANAPKGELIGGARGAVERNTMRYYLAIEAYLSALSLPQSQQEQARLANWFDSSEQYARQLREISRPDYMAMKLDELARQHSKVLN